MRRGFQALVLVLAVVVGFLIGRYSGDSRSVVRGNSLTSKEEAPTVDQKEVSASRIIHRETIAAPHISAETDGSALHEMSTSPEEMAEFLEETKIRLQSLRQLELSNIVERLALELRLPANGYSLLKSACEEQLRLNEATMEPEALLSSYSSAASLDTEEQIVRRDHEGLEDRLLMVLGEEYGPAILEYQARRTSRIQDAWVLGVVSELLIAVDVSEGQRGALYDQLFACAAQSWNKIPTQSQYGLRRLPQRAAILDSISKVLSASQIELLRRRWTINGLLED